MKIFRRLLSYLEPYRIFLIVSLGAATISTLVALGPPYLVKLLIDQVLIQKNLPLLNYIILGLIALYLLHSGLTTLRIIYVNKVQQGLIFDLRNEVHHHLQRLSLSYFEKRQSGRITSRVINDVETLQAIVSSGAVIFTIALVTLLGSLIILMRLNLKLTLLAMIPMPAITFLVVMFSKKAHRRYRQMRRRLADINAILQENILGIQVTKSFRREKLREEKFIHKGEGYYQANMSVIRIWSVFFPLIMFASALGTVIVLYYGGREVIAGNLSIGGLVAFVSYLGLFYAPINQLNEVNNIFQHGRAAGERIFEVVDTIPEKEKKKAIIPPSFLKGKVEFDKVSFTYEKGKKQKEVLHQVSFTANPGDLIAFVGASGSGKSTIVSLLPRFYEINSGSIRIDGYNVKDFKLGYLRENIGMVLQEPFLFDGTVIQNILFGRPGASKEEVVKAAKIANAHNFIRQLPEDYETEVGERGVKLSVGEKQRITIARVMLKNPPILILDEATSSVDSEAEILIQEALEYLMKGKTSFVIAHRLSTIRNATRILVVLEGKIVEEGTHQELLEKESVYSHFYQMQFKENGKIIAT
ncbi:MAG: multidrug ABC transporter permease [bacterium (Candidatus Ratteibacteria) CG_4_10_14_3_um_filter_41_18]|uniref:Multidrug ABC transporter permease n=2 Tax=Candidatus Ratteibacteria TaxID=2979319 RepID=A0A2M7M2R5_9BACT|nr:MAG: multidrug ABC transporter permease [bacterium (Candidatus Ratteibacteria) CG15_BIG_FIL_POST_REV_8_21_14_020_41_12]PIW74302.1 MAG: multidrug ABC transporter permease [bacterium (Candidatus Ratteibacteria) CG_4_8_14_3_um_filter_41_36]PIX76992.1 MAG: multidrug ABC transporter permease [bacterium (Candidatus Ratteibacteria) CG_4_10_14_3_um_filter_41_18]